MNVSSQTSLFTEFLSYFPKVNLPLTIQHSDQHHFSKTNDVLPDELLEAFIIPNLPFQADEFTEFLPCFQFQTIHKMNHLVIWCARLMHYSFYLVNYSAEAMFLSMVEIAGFYGEKDELMQKMAHIDQDGNLFIVEASVSETQHEIQPANTRKWQMEIDEDGMFLITEIAL